MEAGSLRDYFQQKRRK